MVCGAGSSIRKSRDGRSCGSFRRGPLTRHATPPSMPPKLPSTSCWTANPTREWRRTCGLDRAAGAPKCPRVSSWLISSCGHPREWRSFDRTDAAMARDAGLLRGSNVKDAKRRENGLFRSRQITFGIPACVYYVGWANPVALAPMHTGEVIKTSGVVSGRPDPGLPLGWHNRSARAAQRKAKACRFHTMPGGL